jgi:hypothetical protein
MLLAKTTSDMDTNHSGLFRFIKPSERLKIQKAVGKSLSAFVHPHWESFSAFRELRKTLDRVFHGDDDNDVAPVSARR